MLKRNIILYPVMLVSLLVICAGCGSDEVKKYAAAKINPDIPTEFSLKKLGGEEYVKLSDLKGKPVFLDFWATWCPPCKASMPMVEKMYENYRDKVNFIGVNLDVDIQKAVKYVQEKEVPYLQLEGTNTDIQARYGIHGIPAFFILDENGAVVEQFVGYRPELYNSWTKIFDEMIEK